VIDGQISDSPDEKLDEIRLTANKDKSISEFKKVEDLKVFMSEDKLKKAGGEYVLKELMTYENSFNKHYTDSIRWEVDPNRMVWAIQIQYSQNKEFEPGRKMKNPLVTNILDAETGEVITFSWKASDY